MIDYVGEKADKADRNEHIFYVNSIDEMREVRKPLHKEIGKHNSILD
jgi:hypothetical protein